MVVPVFGQSPIIVKGSVTDADNGETLIGVSVKVKGTTQGTSTDVNGAFTLRVPSNAILVFSYIGYKVQEVNPKAVLNIRMQSSTSKLNEVVVVGYGVQRKRDLTGSITQVKGEEIARSPNVNPLSSLQGRVAGLTVVNSGSPGAAPTVRVRGINSTNNSSPLYVVDGVFQSNIDYINPGYIQSIEVLKDPSSIAIVGLQVGNGVIVITTKRADKGKTIVSLQSSIGLQRVQNRIEVADAETFKKLYSAQLANVGANPYDFSNYTANTDWQDLIFRDALISNNSLTISNNSEKSTTLLNFGYNTQEGVVKYGKQERFILRLNEEIRINKGLKVGADVTGFHYNSTGATASISNALWAAPIVPVQADDEHYYSMPLFQRSQVGNPIATLNRNNGTSINKGYRVVGSAYADIKLLKQFTWRSAVYADISNNGSRGYNALPFKNINRGEGKIPTDTTFDKTARTGVYQNQALFRKFQQDHTITFDSTFNKVHKLNAVAGFTTVYEDNVDLSGNRTEGELVIPRNEDFWYIGIVQRKEGNPESVSGGGNKSSQMGFLGRASYSFRDRYLINATIRRDGISRLSPKNRWGTFGGVGLGWVLSEEQFFKTFEAVNFLKIRGGWGTVGSGQSLAANFFQPGVTTSGRGVFGDNVYTSVRPAYIPDPNLRWEVVRGIDVGMDLRAFRERFSAEINLYDRTTKDIITNVTLPSTAGDYSYKTNLGEISNKGIEVALSWNDRIGDDFTFSVAPNFSYNKNKVESIGNNIDFVLTGNGGANRTISGESIGHFYGYRQIGVYQTTADLDRIPGFPDSQPGDIAYADLNGDGVLSPADREYLGTPFPIWNYGVNINLNYKRFDLALQGQGVAGNKVYAQRRTARFADLNYEMNRANAWTEPGTSNVEPILDNTRANNVLFSTYFLEPGDYFRLRTVQLGYTFNPRFLSGIRMSNLRLYLSGQNIKTWSKTTGYSPEAPTGSILGGGADHGAYPVPATSSFGFNVNF